MKVYMAALFSRREEMEDKAIFLRASGYQVVSSWVFGGEEGLARSDIAVLDLDDVEKADILLAFSHPRGTHTPGGGRHIEFGYALARGKICVVIGPRENVFHEHPSVIQYDSLQEFLNHFRPSQQLSHPGNHQTLWQYDQLDRCDAPSKLPSDATTQSS